jgi:hypothetical protein
VQDGGTWSVSLPSNLVQGLADASLTVRASYTSVYGGSASANRSLVVDTTAPSLSVSTPSDTALTATQASTFGLDYTVTDSVTSTPTRQAVVLNAAQQVQSGISFTDSNGRLSADLSTLAEGNYGVKVTSTDQAGNSASQTVNVVIDKTAPTVSITRVDDNIVSQANPVASFVVKDLGLHWQRGEQYFGDHLIDFDLAANNGGWQWASSVGTDAAPYFRVFNPILQSEKFDPNGEYIKKYVPELRGLDASEIHNPSPLMRPKNYPLPIVDRATVKPKVMAFFKRP